ncbi:MAG: 2,3-bisphosphoglycerate-independent phosphoglycerate mutase, partial [bacterium]|nr:2,3-bisphosphoglycerate-independent phosphoglycerate mutase [bacterium]
MQGPLMLMILDGWGHRDDSDFNAVTGAKTPVLDRLEDQFPGTLIATSGPAVGLPPGQMGNSEVGHQNLGAGRIVYQDFTRITKAIEDGEFSQNPVLEKACDGVLRQGSALHLAGLVSDGGVHSHIDHLKALIQLAKQKGLSSVFIHAILDGRDTPPKSGIDYIRDLQRFTEQQGIGQIASVMGRYYAMDRDNRWERVERAYRAMVEGGPCQPTAEAAVQASYDRGETDEFMKPVSIAQEGEAPICVRADDGLIFFNFRADRAREITRVFTEESFSGFSRTRLPLAVYVCMTEYDNDFALPVAFPSPSLQNIFPEVISRAGLTQLRIAETEKYAHVTFFFNGGEELEFPGEKRILIPSPRDVATYDQKPEMSAYLVTAEVVRQIEADGFDVIILNFANGDMVGHTGIYEAAVRAVEAVDTCIGRIFDSLNQKEGTLIIT